MHSTSGCPNDSSDASDDIARTSPTRSPPPSSASTPKIPEELCRTLNRKRPSQVTVSPAATKSASPPRSIRQHILTSDRRGSQLAHRSSLPSVLPVLCASPSSSSPASSPSGPRHAGSPCFPPARLFPSTARASFTGMGVTSSDCHRESPVKSPSSESRLTSPVNRQTATTSASPAPPPPPPRTAPSVLTPHTPAAVPRPPTRPELSLAASCEPVVSTTSTAAALAPHASPVASEMDSASPRPVVRTAAASPTANSEDRPLPAPTATVPSEIAPWSFVPPPDNQRTFLFPEDNNLEFSSEFDSGNLIQVERVAPYRYMLYTAMDCGNSSRQTNNRQWFHFSIRGGVKGVVLAFTVVGMAHSSMFTFDWMPVAAVTPTRPQYTRLPGKATVVPLEVMPETPGFPLLVYKNPASAGAGDATGAGDGAQLEAASDDDNGSGDDDGDESAASPTTAASPTGLVPVAGAKKKKKKKKKKGQAMNLSFEYRLEAENAPDGQAYPLGHPLCAAVYLASNHPYSYSTLQRHIQTWKTHAAGRLSVSASTGLATGGVASRASSMTPPPPPRSRSVSPVSTPVVAEVPSLASEPAFPGSTGVLTPRNASAVYVHHEVMCRTLEGRNVDLLTITDMHGMQESRLPLISEVDALPVSSAEGTTLRPRQFAGKQFVVLTARVHPGECPGSHMMHGAIEFLMSPKDPRAMALRQRFVFFLMPMLNPDGVARGHSRVDADGVDLNRMYQSATLERHPSPYCVRQLTFPLANAKKLALFIDMHAHANKKGTFFYGNAMAAADQVQNILYAKLVSLNTPYLDFTSCNFSESNMFAVGRGGKGKESSSRIVLFRETGFVHSYVIETSHVCAKGFNGIVPLPGIPGEETAPMMASGSILAGGPRHTPDTFADTGKACLVALLDLKSVNPVSRLAATSFQSTKGTALWLQRQMQVEVAEKLFAAAYKLHGKVEPKDASQTPTAAVLLSLTPEEIPDKAAFRSRSLPFCTVQGVADFVTLDECAALLAQTPATGLPRSLFGGSGRQRTASTGVTRNDIPVTIAMPKRRKASRSPTSTTGASGAVTSVTASEEA